MQISKNFTLEELVKSQQAIRLGIDNTPSEVVISNLKGLVTDVLQPLRDKLGKVVSVSSGYRSVELNKAIGGSATSDHCKGFAADIEVPGMSNKDLFEYIKNNFKFKQVILEFHIDGIADSGWVHISHDPNNLKNESLIAKKINGRTTYVKV